MKIDELARAWHQEATLPEKLRQHLLREAPEPPGRSRSRPNLRLVLAGGTVVALGLSTALWYGNHYTLPSAPVIKREEPNPNGYLTAVEACKLEVRLKDGIKTATLPPEPAQPLAGRKALLAANQKSIAKLREALGQKWLVPASTQAKRTWPELPSFREEARMLTNIAANTSAEQGNRAEAAQCSLDAISLGVHLPQGGALLHGLVGIACESIGEANLWTQVDHMDAKTARATVRRLLDLDAQRVSYSEMLAQERLSHQRTIRKLFERGPLGAWKDLDTELNPLAGMPDPGEAMPTAKPGDSLKVSWLKTKAVYYGPRTAIESMDRWLTALGKLSEQPWQAHRAIPPIPTDPLCQLYAPTYTNGEFVWRRKIAYHRLLITYTALHAYQKEKGHVAPSLQALVTEGYLPKLPIDPFSPTQSSFFYRNWRVWSVGPDAKDDGGVNAIPGKTSPLLENQLGDLVSTDSRVY